jgi:hypothetical protein
MASYTWDKSGWVRVQGQSDREHELLNGILYFRGRHDAEGRYRIHEIYIDASDGNPLTMEDLRRVQLYIHEAVANDTPELRRKPTLGPDLSGRMKRLFSKAPTIVSGFAGKPMPEAMLRNPGPDRDNGFRLTEGPGADGLTIDFLTKVADAYRAAMARGERPNVTISEDTRYGRRTVESWVVKARARGLLAPGRKGVAG